MISNKKEGEVLFFRTQNKFKKWLNKNHDKQKEQWIGFYKKASGKASIDWPQSVDAALCFGWIDGIRKSIDEQSYKIRFTPRRPKSNWSAVNIKRVKELTKLGLMHESGLKVFNDRDVKKSEQYSYENRRKGFDNEYENKFRLNKKAWKFFSSQPPWYQRAAAYWVISAKKTETREKRFLTLIEDSVNGKLIKPMIRPETKQRK